MPRSREARGARQSVEPNVHSVHSNDSARAPERNALQILTEGFRRLFAEYDRASRSERARDAWRRRRTRESADRLRPQGGGS